MRNGVMARVAGLALVLAGGSAWAQCGGGVASAASEGMTCQELPRTAEAYDLLATGQPSAMRSGPSIVGVASGDSRFSTLVKLVKAADLVSVLDGEGPFTVLAPTDDAFAKLDRKLVASLLEPKNKALLQSVLLYHVISGQAMSSDVAKLEGAATVNGQRVDIVASRTGITVDKAKVIIADVRASNGVIHAIDTVLLPETKNLAEVASSAGSFRALVTFASAAGLVPALTADQPLTILAPTDEAFEALGFSTILDLLQPENRDMLASILKDHVIAGRVYSDQVAGLTEAGAISGRTLEISASRLGITVGGARVIKADVEATNGVIHVIDRVILPQGS